ncbi:MAG: hypothetical protein SGI77_02020 [Pirellulaceae bacterium]|nr:hypothetical protein [Pirellulaceae bacterium]
MFLYSVADRDSMFFPNAFTTFGRLIVYFGSDHPKVMVVTRKNQKPDFIIRKLGK